MIGCGHILRAVIIFFIFSSVGCASKTDELRSRSQQNMAIILAKEILLCEEIYFVEYAAYTDDFSALGCTEDLLLDHGGAPYTIYLSKESCLDLSRVHYELPSGFEPVTQTYHFRAVVVGNIDQDPSPDVWIIDENNEPDNMMNDLADEKGEGPP